MSKALAKKESTAVGEVIDYSEHAGEGFEGDTQDDVQIPFIKITQSLSPEKQEEEEDYIEGIQDGDIFNSVTREILNKKFIFIPCSKERSFAEYMLREQGGGFKGKHTADSELVQQAKAANKRGPKGELMHPTEANHQLVDTMYLYGLVVGEGGSLEPAVLAFTSTKWTPYRKWNTMASSCTVTIGGKKDPESGEIVGGKKIKPPLFAHQIEVSTVRQKNTKGTFYNIKLSPPVNGNIHDSLLKPSDPRFQAALELSKLIRSGDASAVEDVQECETVKSDGEGIF